MTNATTALPASEGHRCCQWHDSPCHDALLKLEANGLALAELLHHVAGWHDNANTPGYPHPEEWVEFVACHNWTDPYEMWILALNLKTIYEACALRSEERRKLAVSRHMCTCGLAHRNPEHHAWLLSVEQRGAAGLVELFQHMDLSSDGETDDKEIGWLDFPEFVAGHSWTDPQAMFAFAEFVDSAIRNRRDLYRLASTG